MFLPTDAPPIENPQMLEQAALEFIDTFCSRAGFRRSGHAPQSTVVVELKPGHESAEDEDAALQPPVVLRTVDSRHMLYLRSAELLGRPVSVLEGGLALELAAFFLGRQMGRFKLNFERQILPGFNVSGSAVQFLRRLVMHLENGLKRLEATRTVIRAGFGPHLFYYYYHIVQPSEDDRRHYRHLIPHNWMRAMYLAQKNSVYMPLALLDEAGIASGLKALWRDCHEFLTPEDRQLIAELTEIPRSLAERSFADHTVAMSHKLRERMAA